MSGSSVDNGSGGALTAKISLLNLNLLRFLLYQLDTILLLRFLEVLFFHPGHSQHAFAFPSFLPHPNDFYTIPRSLYAL